MNLLSVLEEYLGDIELWPLVILRYLFIDPPSLVRSDRPKKVIAFFYGNDVPCVLAYRFYTACNGKASQFVAKQFYKWYYVWHMHRCKRHMAEYWNMRLGKFIYINGSLLNQSEPVLPQVSDIEFGVDGSKFPHAIHTTLAHTRYMCNYLVFLCYRRKCIMLFLISLLELVVGDVSTWPTDIILAIFVEPPTTPNLLKTCAFYGNGVPVNIASQFYNRCNPYGASDVNTNIHSIYRMWVFQAGNTLRHVSYYDVQLKQMRWINGEDVSDKESATHGESYIPLGFLEIDYGEMIVTKLNEISQDRCVLHLL